MGRRLVRAIADGWKNGRTGKPAAVCGAHARLLREVPLGSSASLYAGRTAQKINPSVGSNPKKNPWS